MLDPEKVWGDLLSRERDRIVQIWSGLSEEERASVRAHLVRMTREDGWLQSQRESARIALRVLVECPPE